MGLRDLGVGDGRVGKAGCGEASIPTTDPDRGVAAYDSHFMSTHVARPKSAMVESCVGPDVLLYIAVAALAARTRKGSCECNLSSAHEVRIIIHWFDG